MENLFSENIQTVQVKETYVKKIKLLDQLVYSIEDGFVVYDKKVDSQKGGGFGDMRTVSFKENPRLRSSLYLEITENDPEWRLKNDKTIGVRITFPFLLRRLEYVFPLDYTKEDLTTLFGYLKKTFQSKTYEKVRGELKKLL